MSAGIFRPRHWRLPRPDFVLSALKSGEIDSLKQNFPILRLQTGAELLRSTAIRDELGLLSAPDRKRFEQMIEKFITDNGPVMSASLDAQIAAAGGSTQPTTVPEADRAKQARQAFDQAMQQLSHTVQRSGGTLAGELHLSLPSFPRKRSSIYLSC